MLHLWRKSIRMLREIGPLYAASIMLRKVVPARIFYIRSFYLMDRDLRGWAERPHDDPNVRWATEDDVERIAAIMWDAATIRARFCEGARVAILLRDGGVRACSWFKGGIIDHDHWLRLVVPEDATCSMFIFTPIEERGRGHFTRVVGFGSREAARQGLKRVFSITDRLNRNSWTATEKLGGRRVGTIFAVGAFGWLAVRIGRSWRFGRWRPARRLRLPFDVFDAGWPRC